MVNRLQIQEVCKKLNCTLIKYYFLAKGNHNENYILETNQGKKVLRIENNLMFKNLKKEYKILKQINGKLGPKVYLFDESHKIIKKDFFVEEFIEGAHPKKRLNRDFLESMAKWYKTLHKIKTLKKQNTSLKKAIKPYYENYKKYQYVLDKETRDKLKISFKQSLTFCEKNDKIFGNKRLSLLHRDPSRGNIFYRKDFVKLIDWEFAEYDFPEKEIINFFNNYKLKESQKEIFLSTYGYIISKLSKKKFEIIYILNFCGDIGYSIWRLGLLKKKEIQENKKERIERLKKDITLLEKSLIKMKNLN